MRRIAGAPTYLLTDYEKTASVEHVAGIAVCSPAMVAFARHYGVTQRTSVQVDPAFKGGSDVSVKIS